MLSAQLNAATSLPFPVFGGMGRSLSMLLENSIPEGDLKLSHKFFCVGSVCTQPKQIVSLMSPLNWKKNQNLQREIWIHTSSQAHVVWRLWPGFDSQRAHYRCCRWRSLEPTNTPQKNQQLESKREISRRKRRRFTVVFFCQGIISKNWNSWHKPKVWVQSSVVALMPD